MDGYVLLGNGDGTFQVRVAADFNGDGKNTFMATGDFNGDGKPDLAVANAYYAYTGSPGFIAILLNTTP